MLEIWTFIGVKMAVTRFVTHITHVSRHFGVYNIKKHKKNNCLGKIYVSTKLLLEKMQKNK